MAGKNEVSIWIRAKDLASSKLKGFERNLNAVWRSAKNVAKGVAAVGVAAGAAVVGLGKLADRGGKYLTVSAAFERATNGQVGALQKLQAAAGGLIGKFDLMTGFNQAIALGSAKSVEGFSDMIGVAQKLSRSLGIDMSYALESLNTGIARQSKRWLDNLGIIIDVDAANKAYAKSIGKSTAALTENEKKEAFRQAALKEGVRIAEQMGDSTGKAGDSWRRFTVAMEDARDKAGQFVAESEQMTDFFAGLEAVIDRLVDKIPGLISNLSAAVTAAESLILGTNTFGVAAQANIGFRSARAQADRYEDPADQLRFLIGRTTSAMGDREASREALRVQGLRIQDSPADRQRAREQTGESFFEAAVVTPAEVARFEQLQEEVTVHERLVELLQAEIALRNKVVPGSGGGGGGGGGGAGLPGLNIGLAGVGSGTEAGRLMRLMAERSQLSGTPAVSIGDYSTPSEVAASYRKGKEGAEDMSGALLASVNAFEDVSMAALGTGRDMEDILLPAITGIAMALPGVGQLGAALISTAGSLAGALFSGRDRPRVVIDEYGPKAERTMRDVNKDVVRDVFINGQLASDEQVRELGYRQGRIARLRGESSTGV